MKKKVSQGKLFLLMASVLVIVLLATNTTFIGSLLGGYENNEPKNIGEFLAVIDLYNGQYSYQGVYDINTHSYDEYYTSSDLGVINVFVISDMSCSDFLLMSHQADNSSDYVVLKGRQVLDLDSGYLFCNFNNNLALKVSDFSTMSDYVDSFETFNGVPLVEEEVESEEQVIDVVAPLQVSESVNETAVNELEETKPFNNSLLLIGLIVLVVIVFVIIETTSRKKVVIKHKRGKRR